MSFNFIETKMLRNLISTKFADENELESYIDNFDYKWLKSRNFLTDYQR